MAQLVKNLAAMQENWVLSLGWEDPLVTGKTTHSSNLAWRIPYTVHGVANSQTQLSNFHFKQIKLLNCSTIYSQSNQENVVLE